MKNVIESLRNMAEHGGYWNVGTGSKIWYLGLLSYRSNSSGGVGFTQDELREFMKHYEELLVERDRE